MKAASRKFLIILILSGQCVATATQAEFIGNAFGGQAEEMTRSGAARVFEGHQNFYQGMSQLEQRKQGNAKESFQSAVRRFQEGQKEYQGASQLLKDKAFDFARLEPAQRQLLLQFLAPFGAKEGADQATMLQAYASSFTQTAGLVQSVVESKDLSLPRFREIQILINRQIITGTFISQGLGR